MLNDLFHRYGVWLLFANVFLEQIGLPVPALPTLILAGSLAFHQSSVLMEFLLASVVACELADFSWYWAGRRFGNRVMRLLCRVSLNPDSCVSETQLRFERWGYGALVIAKFVPGLATIAPPLAGVTRMNVGRFAVYSTIGSLLWIVIGLGAGVWLGPQILALWPQVQHEGRLIVWVMIVLILLYLAYKFIQRQRFLTTLRMARVGVSELYELIESGAAPIVVDVRSAMARNLEPRRIPGAISITLQTISQQLQGLPTDRDIILYCSCPNEASAARVAKILISHGYHRVRPLLGGLEAWIAAGYRFE